MTQTKRSSATSVESRPAAPPKSPLLPVSKSKPAPPEVAQKPTKTVKATAVDDLLGDDKAKPWYFRPILWIGLVLLIAVGAGVWWWLQKRAADALPAYNTQPAVIGDITLSVIANGTLQPTRTYAVGSELSGTVLRVNVDVNDVVRQGQVLVELDTSKLADQITRTRASLASAMGSVAQADATVREARIGLKRLETVWRISNGQVPARAEIDAARATLARGIAAGAIARASVAEAQAALSTDQINLSKAYIRAPANGVVLTRTVEPGSAVAASFQAVTLFTLAADLSRLRVWGYVDEADVGVVAVGQEATFTVSAFLNRTFPANVTRVGSGSTITDNVVTYLTYLDVDNADLSLRPGMTANATIIAKEHKGVLTVPNTALRFSPTEAGAGAKKKGISLAFGPNASKGGAPKSGAQTASTAGAKKVYILQDGQPKAIAITLGISDGRMTEILSGDLRVGMQVITEQRAKGTK
jgi:HlyD family secretion protein